MICQICWSDKGLTYTTYKNITYCDKYSCQVELSKQRYSALINGEYHEQIFHIKDFVHDPEEIKRLECLIQKKETN